MTNRAQYKIEKKLVVQVRYYESMFIIRDAKTEERIYAGSDEATALGILRALNKNLVKPKKHWPKRILKTKRRKS